MHGSNIFLRGSNFFAWVFAWVKIFYVDPKFLRWSTFIYQTRLFSYTSINGLENFFESPFPSQQILTKPCLTTLVFLSSLLAKVDQGPLQCFRWHLLWHYLKAYYLLNKELCIECCRVLHAPVNAINILQLGKIHHQMNSIMTFS